MSISQSLTYSLIISRILQCAVKGVFLSSLLIVWVTSVSGQEPQQTGQIPSVKVVEVNRGTGKFRPSKDRARLRPAHPPIETIPPIPFPEKKADLQPRANEGPGSGIAYDVFTEKTTLTPADEMPAADALKRGGGWRGLNGDQGRQQDFLPERMNGSMTAIGDTSLFPWRMNVKLVMRFQDSAGTDLYFVASGSMLDAETVLTAGHCVFDRSMGLGWAKEIWVYPGWDGEGGLLPETVYPYGLGNSTWMHSWTSWTVDGNFDYDIGAIEINRCAGMLTGWYGSSYGGDCSFHTSTVYGNGSYPAESCNGTLHTGETQYYWTGTFDACVGNRLQLNTSPGCLTAVWGGMSGSGAYYTQGESRYVQAVTSTSNRSTVAYYVQQWQNWVNYLNDTIIPSARGGSFDVQALNANAEPSTIYAGSSTSLFDHVAANPTNGSANGTWTFNVYLSENDNISSSDTLLSTLQYSWNFTSMSAVNPTGTQVTIPSNTPAGNYYLGIEYVASTDGDSTNNATHTWDAVPITVEVDSCAARALVRLSGEAIDGLHRKWSKGWDALSMFYRYRDEVLSKTPLGRAYVEMYYDHSEELTKLLLTDSTISERARTVVISLMPRMDLILDGEAMELSEDDRVAIVKLLELMRTVSSVELRQSIEVVHGDLRDGKLSRLLAPQTLTSLSERGDSRSIAARLSYWFSGLGGLFGVAIAGLVWSRRLQSK